MTPVFCCGFECGISGSVGQHFLLAGTSSINTNSSFVRTGARSIRCNPTAGTGNFAAVPVGATKWVIRTYIYFSSLPTSNCSLISIGASSKVGLYFKSSDSKLYCGFGADGSATFGTTGVVVTTGVWYQLDLYVDVSLNPWTIDAKVDTVSCAQLTNAVAASTGSATFGILTTNNTCDLYFDDLIISKTLADYPIGQGKVVSYVPNADGSHTSTSTNIVKGTIATPVGTAITSATTDAFNWVNGRPLLGGATDNTRLINQQTASAAQYVEVNFENSAEDRGPRSVEVITAERQAATTAGDMTIFFCVDNGNSTSTIVSRAAAAGVVTDRFTTKQFATSFSAGNPAWTAGSGNASHDLNLVKAQFGYSGDATPDQYWRGIMIEAEYDTTALAASDSFDPMGVMGFFGL